MHFRNALRNPLTAVLLFSAVLVLCAAVRPAVAEPPMKVIYGFDREYPPYSFEEAAGKPAGFDVDLIQAILQEDNVRLIMRPLTWDQVQVELSAGNIQVSSGLAVTKQRQLLYKFADKPTMPMQIKLFTNPAARVGNVTLLRGQTVAVEKGSYQQRVLEEFGGLNIKLYRSKTEALKALYNDEVVAYGGPTQTAYYLIDKLKLGTITAVGTPLVVSDTYFAVNRDQDKLLAMINRGMLRIIQNGEYDRIYRKWFVPDLHPEEYTALYTAARNAAINAYAPYSRVPVGAAVLTRSGRIVTGCNVENSLISESQTALRTAVLKAVSEGEYEFRAVVSVAPDGSVMAPSAGDRQFLYEFGRGILCVVQPQAGKVELKMVSELLPYPHDSRPQSYQY